jgi:hypothetical protein
MHETVGGAMPVYVSQAQQEIPKAGRFRNVLEMYGVVSG